jgi:peptidoglycan hydrolase-like protein with peptidoglycan-binding domain
MTVPAESEMSEANRREVQEALKRLNYYKGSLDGIFGAQTRAAIRRYQQAVGANATGHLTAVEATHLVSQ